MKPFVIFNNLNETKLMDSPLHNLSNDHVAKLREWSESLNCKCIIDEDLAKAPRAMPIYDSIILKQIDEPRKCLREKYMPVIHEYLNGILADTLKRFNPDVPPISMKYTILDNRFILIYEYYHRVTYAGIDTIITSYLPDSDIIMSAVRKRVDMKIHCYVADQETHKFDKLCVVDCALIYGNDSYTPNESK